MPTTLYTETEIKTIVKQVAEQIKEQNNLLCWFVY